MNCESVKSTLGAFADGELGDLDAGQIRTHIDTCVSCKADLEEILAVRSALQHWPAHKPSPGLDYRVMESFRAEHQVRRDTRPSVFRFGAFLAGSVQMPKIAVPAALAA